MSFYKNLKCNLIAAAAFAAAITASSAANATPIIPAGWSAAVFDVTINAGFNPITRITTFVKTTTSAGYGRFSTVVPGFNEFYAPVPPQGGVVVSSFAAGVISGLPGDPSGSPIQHLVVFGKFTAAQLTLDYNNLFPDITESTIISDLLNTPNTSPLPQNDYLAFIGDAAADGLYATNGSSIKAVAFSTGIQVGTGTFSITPKPAPVPEPMTIAMFGTALAGMAAARRAKKQA